MNVTRTVPLLSPHVNLGANPATAGVTALVAGVAGAKYRVLSIVVITTIANSIKFQSNASDISATFPLGANGGLVIPFSEQGLFETNPGEALNINMTAISATGVQIQYIKLPA